MVRRHLHNEGFGIPRKQPFAKYQGHTNRQNNSQKIYGKQYASSPTFREKSRNQQGINRQPRTATHQRRNQNGHHAVSPVLQRPGTHDRGNAATETQQQRNKGFSMQAHSSHHPIHYKCRPGHITGIFQQGNSQKKQQNTGQKGYDAPDSANHSVNHERTQFAFCHVGSHSFPKPLHALFQPALGNFAYCKNHIE